MAKKPILIPIDRLLWPEPVVAGCNYLVIASLTYFYRSGNEHAKAIKVVKEGDYWRIKDGRHRSIASMIAGRKVVLAKIKNK